MRLVTNPASTGFGIGLNDKFEVVMFRRPFTELQHLWKLVGRIDVQNGKRNAPQESLAGKPDQHVVVFTHGPGHADTLERVIRLAENKDALVLEIVEMSALGRCCHFDEGRSIQSGSSCCNEQISKNPKNPTTAQSPLLTLPPHLHVAIRLARYEAHFNLQSCLKHVAQRTIRRSKAMSFLRASMPRSQRGER